MVDGSKKNYNVTLVEILLLYHAAQAALHEKRGWDKFGWKANKIFVIRKEYLKEYKMYHPKTKKVNGWKDIVLTIVCWYKCNEYV